VRLKTFKVTIKYCKNVINVVLQIYCKEGIKFEGDFVGDSDETKAI